MACLDVGCAFVVGTTRHFHVGFALQCGRSVVFKRDGLGFAVGVAAHVNHTPGAFDLVGAVALLSANPNDVAVHEGGRQVGRIHGAIVHRHREPTCGRGRSVGLSVDVKFNRHVAREKGEFRGGFIHHRNELLCVRHVATCVGGRPLPVPRA